MSEMIERVARAIYNQPTKFDGDQIGVHLSQSMMIEGSAKNLEELREFVMTVCRDAARAAIEAMQEPTEEMIAVGTEVEVPGNNDEGANEQIGGYAATEVYSAMIREALK